MFNKYSKTEQVHFDIMSRIMKEEWTTELPSIRDMASNYKEYYDGCFSTVLMQVIYAELKSEGIITASPRKCFFINEDAKNKIQNVILERKEKLIEEIYYLDSIKGE